MVPGRQRLVWTAFLFLASVPLWISWKETAFIPFGDELNIVGSSVIRYVHGESFWSSIHHQYSDSRYDFLRLIHIPVVLWSGWDTRYECVVVTLLGIVCAAAYVSLVLRSPVGETSRGCLVAVLGTAVYLSTQSYRNWMDPCQSCYLIPMAAGFMMPHVFLSRLPLAGKVVLAAALCWAGTFSFLVGVSLWPLAFGFLMFEKSRADISMKRFTLAAGGLILAALICAWIFAADWTRPARLFGEHETQFRSQGADMVRDVAVYALKLLGAFWSVGWPGLNDRPDSTPQSILALGAGILLFVVFAALAIAWLRESSRNRNMSAVPWLLLGAWAVTNAFMTAVGRAWTPFSNPFESRYLAFTEPLLLSVLVLTALMRGRAWKYVGAGILAATAYGMAVGFIEGVNYVKTQRHREELMGTVVMFRHIEPHAEYLRVAGEYPVNSLVPDAPPEETFLDEIESRGWLRVPVVASTSVAESTLRSTTFARGGFRYAKLGADGSIVAHAWAFDREARTEVSGLALSLQLPGGEERWIGASNQRLPDYRLAARFGVSSWDRRLAFACEVPAAAWGPSVAAALKPGNGSPVSAGSKTLLRAYALRLPDQMCLIDTVEIALPALKLEP
jgi:hypothetical protein